ncbi:MAG TPA: glycoside hydrolase family 9 protein [Nonomuraea sp.]|uniref:glycoside hydrolase family 9 protein n=1 Tax=Nonomuraea sp. NPDC049649 TaxID=3155776 RepID=UPI002C5E7932|nr:glycoside hydrolase family 9 protein [Nonomuraea sp.]
MTRRLSAALALLTAFALAPAAPAHAADEGPEQIVNGTFDDGTAPWWGTPNLTLGVEDGRLCADVPGDTANPWDVIIGQDNLPLVEGETYAFSFYGSASETQVVRALVQLPVDPWTQYLSAAPELSAAGDVHEFTFTAPVSLPDAQVAFQIGGSAEPWRFCMDDVSLRGGAEPEQYEPDTGPRVRVNMVGYLPSGPKNATVVTDAPRALKWELKDASGRTVAHGKSTPRGLDESSGERVHSIDFGKYRKPGTGFTLTVDGETSRPFDIAEDLYDEMRTDALKFYYTQRSGIEIRDDLRPGYGRPAGHVGVAPNQGDISVPCQPGVCDYSLDVRGGWYDAGDHGKYVVNGGISVHQLMSLYERDKAASKDGQLNIPESGNGVPDVLDEARWEQEFLLSMQVPDGERLAGMAHHKIHDAQWTGLPLLPHLDPQPRELHPPSTAATLNLAATAAQAARVFAPYDAAFAARNLAAARKAWAAALANPDLLADPNDGVGGGAYNDADVSDEFYWAAAELFITTGEKEFARFVQSSPHHTGDIWRERGFDWGNTAQLGRLQLATVPNAIPDRARVRRSVVEGAEKYLATQRKHPYGLPYNPPDFDWGSNNLVLNNMVVMAVAYDLTGKEKYREGVREGMDYILGRNALNQSYVTGYGEVSSQNQHSRWYARQLDPSLPNPPRGTLSGGPNSAIQDPVAQRLLQGCKPQFCYIDHIESWATNELTINWNAPLAWISAFLADRSGHTHCDVRYTAGGGRHFTAQVTVRNHGPKSLDDWELRWWFPGAQRVQNARGATVTQDGPVVTASGKRVKPRHAITFGFTGTTPAGPNPAPEVFYLNGERCR